MDQSKFPRPLQTTRTYCLGPPALFQPTTTFPGPSILIPTSPDHQRHHPSFHTHHRPLKASSKLHRASWSIKSTVRTPTLFQVN
jgi:hypothetical protein